MNLEFIFKTCFSFLGACSCGRCWQKSLSENKKFYVQTSPRQQTGVRRLVHLHGHFCAPQQNFAILFWTYPSRPDLYLFKVKIWPHPDSPCDASVLSGDGTAPRRVFPCAEHGLVLRPSEMPSQIKSHEPHPTQSPFQREICRV